MADQIRVLIVDDIPETRDHLTKLLGFESDIEVVGSAASGSESLTMAGKMLPDAVVMMSVQGEADYLRRSMLAGAREFLVKPFSSDELTASIRQVYTRERDKQSRMSAMPVMAGTPGGSSSSSDDGGQEGQVIAIFSPKGGVGRTTV